MNTYLMQLSGDVACFKAVTPETKDDAVTDGLKHYDAVVEIEVAGNRVQRIRQHTKEPEPMTDRSLELLERIALALEARR